MLTRLLITGTLTGGLVLSWVTAAILSPRCKAIQGFPRRCGGDSLKCIGKRHQHHPQGLFVSVSLRSRLQSFGPRIAGQLVVEFAVALACHCWYF